MKYINKYPTHTHQERIVLCSRKLSYGDVEVKVQLFDNQMLGFSFALYA